MMEYHDIIKMFIYFYLIMLINFIILYLKSTYDQYKNAHDKWYDINGDIYQQKTNWHTQDNGVISVKERSSAREKWPRASEAKNEILLSAMKRAWECGYHKGCATHIDRSMSDDELSSFLRDNDWWSYDSHDRLKKPSPSPYRSPRPERRIRAVNDAFRRFDYDIDNPEYSINQLD